MSPDTRLVNISTSSTLSFAIMQESKLSYVSIWRLFGVEYSIMEI